VAERRRGQRVGSCSAPVIVPARFPRSTETRSVASGDRAGERRRFADRTDTGGLCALTAGMRRCSGAGVLCCIHDTTLIAGPDRGTGAAIGATTPPSRPSARWGPDRGRERKAEHATEPG
jgi:hypothetical protein